MGANGSDRAKFHVTRWIAAGAAALTTLFATGCSKSVTGGESVTVGPAPDSALRPDQGAMLPRACSRFTLLRGAMLPRGALGALGRRTAARG
jgi:hypothetical protein